MRRFFIDPANVNAGKATITGTEAHHLSKVLRLAVGNEISLFDGLGNVYQAEIEEITRNGIKTTILRQATAKSQKPYLHLGLGLLKGTKMDLIVQKATELGVEALHPFNSRYCAVWDKSGNRLERWQRIALEACKQCDRPAPPVVYPAQNFTAVIAALEKFDKKIIFWEKEETVNLREIISPASPVQKVFAITGPEGGFSDQEIALARDAGFRTVTLGKKTLRAETAAIAAISILQFQLGNLEKPG